MSNAMARAHSHGAGTQATYSSRADRPSSFNPADIPVPNGREEDWRFTPIKRIQALFDESGYAEADLPVSVTAPSEVSVSIVDAKDFDLDKILAPGDRTAVVSWVRANSVNLIEIPKGKALSEPVFINISNDDETPRSQRIYVRANEASEAVVVINHKGKGKLNQTVEIDAAEAAKLTVVSLQEWDDTATHASNHRMRAGRDTQLRHVVVTLGGDLVRLSADTEFASPRGNIEMLGLYFVDAGQHLEHRPFIAHTQPHCYSRVTYKGALQGKDAQSVWVGDCLIGANADGTDTYELNRNLVLSEGARADSVPNLEIENGEIEGAGHASATGRFDDEQLFYLMARGISERDARRLVVLGFFGELVNQIGVPSVQEHLMETIEAELEKGGSMDKLVSR